MRKQIWGRISAREKWERERGTDREGGRERRREIEKIVLREKAQRKREIE